MNILVLGSEGQIGKPFCKLAESKGHTVIRVDKKLGEWHDLSKQGCILNTAFSIDFDICVFLAFEVGGAKYLEANDKTLEYITENMDLMSNSFKFLSAMKRPFIFASSQMSNMHSTNYGFLKDLGERLAQTSSGHICRFWNVYGHEDPSDPKSHVITDFIHMAKQGRIVMRTTGEEERQFLYTDDCSRALLHWCENHFNYTKNQYIDITSFKWNSVMDVAKIIQKEIPCEITVGSSRDKIQGGIKNNPSPYVLNYWKPEISLVDGIKKLL